MATGREEDAARLVGGAMAMRLNLSTAEAPFERMVLDFYPWVDAFDERPELEFAREEGRLWSRDELVQRAFDLVRQH